MDALAEAIATTPIIDHHAHNLLTASGLDKHDFLAITSEASGSALKHTPSTLAHLRAVKGLSQILDCEPSWEAVHQAIASKRQEPHDAWARRCFQGIEMALIDDGLDPSDVHSYEWHNRLTRSECKRIVRIETVAEDILLATVQHSKDQDTKSALYASFIEAFQKVISNANHDPQVAGFKSVICYRSGLEIRRDRPAEAAAVFASMLESDYSGNLSRLEDVRLNQHLVHITAQSIHQSVSKKPFQFHTGLGDNDIDLDKSNPAHLQSFIENYPSVPIVLLHASYPFTTQAGYLASVYENCFLDIGEVFPMVSQDGQEKIIREALELCPSEKLLWSTDGHWFPETYLLAVEQAREGLKVVLGEYVERGSLTSPKAANIVRDIFFNTANKLYDLNIPFHLVNIMLEHTDSTEALSSPWSSNLAHLKAFLREHRSITWLRLQWLDYTSTPRVRLLPVTQALELFSKKKSIGITKAVFGLLQNDAIVPGFSPVGEYMLYPCLSEIRVSTRPNHAIVPCEFQEKESGETCPSCPRTALRQQEEKAAKYDITFLVGFEIEIVFMSRAKNPNGFSYGEIPVNEGGHSWSNARALQSDALMDMFDAIFSALSASGITLQQFHPESGPGQYEFILPPLPPLQAVDSLLLARETIAHIAANHNLRATLIPKTSPLQPGTGAHTHISLEPAHHWHSFYAGVLKHLRAISAFTYPNDASYERVVDGVWAGSTWVCWGTQNRETPLRRIEGSHFEIKCMDGLANMYLALAAIIGAGLQGVINKQPLEMQDCLADPAQLLPAERVGLGIEQQFPRSIKTALWALEDDIEMKEILGEVVEVYRAVKWEEAKILSEMDDEERRRWLIERY